MAEAVYGDHNFSLEQQYCFLISIRVVGLGPQRRLYAAAGSAT